jgi:hypothetical protein
MKNFKEYLTESQKVYSFKIKVAGPVPEKFAESVKARLEKYGCGKFEQKGSTPIQMAALDFPSLSNVEVTMFEAECVYPVTSPEILEVIKNSTKVCETHLRVRNLREEEMFEFDSSIEVEEKKKKTALLNDPDYKEAAKVKSKDYFGADFNKSFLKDLQKTAKQRKKDAGHKDLKTEITNDGPDFGGPSASPIGSSK